MKAEATADKCLMNESGNETHKYGRIRPIKVLRIEICCVGVLLLAPPKLLSVPPTH